MLKWFVLIEVILFLPILLYTKQAQQLILVVVTKFKNKNKKVSYTFIHTHTHTHIYIYSVCVTLVYVCKISSPPHLTSIYGVTIALRWFSILNWEKLTNIFKILI